MKVKESIFFYVHKDNIITSTYQSISVRLKMSSNTDAVDTESIDNQWQIFRKIRH